MSNEQLAALNDLLTAYAHAGGLATGMGFQDWVYEHHPAQADLIVSTAW